MPADVDQNGKVGRFFKPAVKFGARYATLGFNDVALLDDGMMWPTEYAVTGMSAAVAASIDKLVRKAVGLPTDGKAPVPSDRRSTRLVEAAEHRE